MNFRRLVFAVCFAWILLMLFSRPLSRVLGPTYVDKGVDVLFYLIMAGFGVMLVASIWREKSLRVSRINVFDMTINGQPAHMFLDTGASKTVLFNAGARRLGLEFARLPHVRVNLARGLLALSSGPVHMRLGAQNLDVPFPVLKLPLYARSKGYDGLIGWPEIQDNIVVFDPARRLVSRVEKLPEETATWLKLKIRPAGILAFEIPLAKGQTGAILVDTGSPWGVCLPTAQWKKWRTAHPRAPKIKDWLDGFALSFAYLPGALFSTRDEMWADEVGIGPLTLADVPVRKAHALQSARCDGYAGSLGMSALARMDLIVDGRDGFAYARPKPPGPRGPDAKRGDVPQIQTQAGQDWFLAENVRMAGNYLLAFSHVCRGLAERNKAQYDLAVAEFTRALEFDPKNDSAYLERGLAKDSTSDQDGAISDYDRVLELDPKNARAHFLRGIAKAKRPATFAGAGADFERAQELGMNRFIIGLVRYLIRSKLWN